MAIHARPPDRADQRGTVARRIGQGHGLTWVTVVRVAVLTEHRRTRTEQTFNIGTVRLVADRTILRNGLMVMHEGAALLHVAGVARLVGAGLDQLLGIVAVHRVAGRAGHLAFDDRVVRGLVDLGALFLVAGETHVRLCPLVEYLVTLYVDLVAGRASHILRTVHAGLPSDPITALVATRAGFVAFFRRSLGAFSEIPVRRRRGVRSTIAAVAVAVAVTIGTGRRASVGTCAVTRLADGQHRRMPPRNARLGIVGLVVAGGAFSVAVEYQTLGLAILFDLFLDLIRRVRHANTKARYRQPQPDQNSPMTLHVLSPNQATAKLHHQSLPGSSR